MVEPLSSLNKAVDLALSILPIIDTYIIKLNYIKYLLFRRALDFKTLAHLNGIKSKPLYACASQENRKKQEETDMRTSDSKTK